MKMMTNNWLLAVMAAGLCLSSTGLRADDKDNEKDKNQSADQSAKQAEAAEPAGAESDKASADKKFTGDIARASVAEVKIGELAEQKGQSESVKQYGKLLAKDHQELNQKVKEVWELKNPGKTFDPKSTDLGEHQKTIDHLASLSGEEFDKAFIEHSVTDHQKCIKKVEKAASEAQEPAVRSFASAVLPKLQEHLKIAQLLQSNPNASLPIANEPAGAERKSDVPNQGQEQKDQQQDKEQKDQNQGQADEPLKP